MSLAVVAAAAIGAGVFLASGDGEPVAAACRSEADCSRSGMPGAVCGDDGRCAYAGTAAGEIRFDQRVPGQVRVVAYPPAAFDASGPHPAYAAVGRTAALVDRGETVQYQLDELPVGPVVVIAYIDIGDDDPSTTRPCYGDVAGIARVDVPAARRASGVDIDVGVTVADRRVCEGL